LNDSELIFNSKGNAIAYSYYGFSVNSDDTSDIFSQNDLTGLTLYPKFF